MDTDRRIKARARWAWDIPAPETNQLWPESLLEYYKQAGVRQIGLDCNYLMHNDTQDCDLIALKEQLDRHGMKAATSHPHFGSWNNSFSTATQKEPRRSYEISWMKEFIRRCGLIGAHAFPLHTGGALLPGAENWELDLVEDYIRQLLPAAEAAQVIIAIENTNHAKPDRWEAGIQDNTVTDNAAWRHDDPELLLAVLRRFQDNPYVGICYDIGHSHLMGEALSTLRMFLPYIRLYHLHDNGANWHDAHLQPGYGNTPWKEAFDLMAGDDRSAPWYIEARAAGGLLPRMIQELEALRDGTIQADLRGYYPKNELSGLLILPSETAVPAEPAAESAICPDPSGAMFIDLSGLAPTGITRQVFEDLKLRIKAELALHDAVPASVYLLNGHNSHAIDSPFILNRIALDLGLGGLALNLPQEDRRARSPEALIRLARSIRFYLDDNEHLWHKQLPLNHGDDSARYLGENRQQFLDRVFSLHTAELSAYGIQVIRLQG